MYRRGSIPLARCVRLSRAPACGVLALLLGSPAPAWGDEAVASSSPELADSWLVPSLHATGLLVTVRGVEAYLWPEPFADLSWPRMRASYQRAFTERPLWDGSRSAFEWDGDWWVINAVGHALLGSELYGRARLCQRSPLEALAFTVAATALWEYGFEATHVQPSGLDLWYTPAAGVVLGEARYWGWRAASGVADPQWRTVLRVVFDPLGEFERVAGAPC